jgi:tetratricopeptide (TPR) repeat protein
MKSFLVLMLMVGAAAGQSAPAAIELSSAERRMAEAQALVREKPAEYTSYNLLATALIARARETDDAGYFGQAGDAVNKSLQLSPNNFEGKKIQAAILLGEHDFGAALDLAKSLNKEVPDDVMVYGLLSDANAALGNYKDAEKAAQWMLDLRPGNLPALLHAASLRELFGDPDGSYELLDLAFQSTSPTETGQRAWILTQMGDVRFASGNLEAAEKLFSKALVAFPNYAYALGGLAQVRLAQKRYGDAVQLLQQRCEAVPRAANLYDLAEALKLAGQDGEAKKAFSEFETKSLQESEKPDNSNLKLIFYYADHARQPAKALQLARQEYSARKDVYTLDAYAWALHVNRQNAEARKQIEGALAVDVRDAKLFRHAGEISLAVGDSAAAQRYLKQAAELNAIDSEQAKLVVAHSRK